MALTTLKDDLLQEFGEERIMISEQMELLDPLGTSLRKPAAQRLLSSTTLFLTEFLCYTLFIGGIAAMIMMPNLYIVKLLNNINSKPDLYHDTLDVEMVKTSILASYGIIAISSIFILIIGRMARTIRHKNDILYQAGKDIKIILGQHLERQAAIDTIEQRHLLNFSGIAMPLKNKPMKVNVNDISNPGFEEEDEDEDEENA